jgi:hypothetical protein
MADFAHPSAEHGPIWELDHGTYQIVVRHPDTETDTEWYFKLRGLTTDETRTIYLGHDAQTINVVDKVYGLSEVALVEGGATLDMGPVRSLYDNVGVWSWMWAPDGDAIATLEGASPALRKIDLPTRTSQSIPLPAETRIHMDPSGVHAWLPDQHTMRQVSLYPFGTLVETPVTNGPVGTLAFGEGHTWYCSVGRVNGPIEDGQFGTIDLASMVATPLFTVPGGTAITWDPFTGHLLVAARDKLHQFDPATLLAHTDPSTMPTPVSTLDLVGLVDPGVALAAPTPDGDGKVFLLAQFGSFELGYLDYSVTGLVGDPSNDLTPFQHVGLRVSTLSPVTGPGSACYAAQGTGTFSPARNTAVPGGRLVISGHIDAEPGRPIRAVRVDGVPGSVDVAGNFFGEATVGVGPQTVSVELFDRCGAITLEVPYVGVRGSSEAQVFTDVTAQMSTTFRNTTWHAGERRLDVEMIATNTSDQPIGGPLRVVLGPHGRDGDLRDQVYEIVQADTTGLDGRQAITMLEAGELLPPGESLPVTEINVYNPSRLSIRAHPVWERPGNQAPWLTSAPTVSLEVDRAWTYRATAVDLEGDALSWALDSAPAGLTMTADGVLSWTPGVGDLGNHDVAITVRDPFGASVTQRFVLDVRDGPANTAPVFTSTPPTQVLPGGTLTYDAEAADYEGDLLVFSGAPGTVVPATGVLTWVAPDSEGHEEALEVTVSDPSGGTAVQRWTVRVTATPVSDNGAPRIVTTPPTQAHVGGLYAYLPVAEDPDGDALTWTVSNPDARLDPLTGALLWTPGAVDPAAPFTLTVRDGTHEVSQVWTVSVSGEVANRAPVFTTYPTPRTGLLDNGGPELTYDADAEDPDGDPVTYGLLGPVPGVSIAPDTGLLTVETATAGEVVVVLTASDGTATALQALTLDIRATNRPPVLWVDQPPALPEENALWYWPASAYDPDGDPVTFSLDQDYPRVEIDPVTGLIEVNTIFDAIYDVVVIATDTNGGSASVPVSFQIFADRTGPTVDVVLPNDPPCAGATDLVCVIAEDEHRTVKFSRLQFDNQTTGASSSVHDVLDDPCVAYTWPDAGEVVEVHAWANDKTFGTATRTDTFVTVTPVTCTLNDFPVVEITTPDDGARLSRPTLVGATTNPSTGATLTDWRVLAYPATHDGAVPEDALTLAEGTGEFPTLPATFDPTLVPNGLWTLRVEADDDALLRGSDEITVLVEVPVKPGNLRPVLRGLRDAARQHVAVVHAALPQRPRQPVGRLRPRLGARPHRLLGHHERQARSPRLPDRLLRLDQLPPEDVPLRGGRTPRRRHLARRPRGAVPVHAQG